MRWIGFRVTFLTDNSAFELVMQFLKYSRSSLECRKVLILGPVLFTIYVNDLLSVPKRCLSASYVDDCKLYLSFSPAELTTSTCISALNEDLIRISQWCCKNSLLINPEKTKVLAVGVPQLLQKLSSFSITLFDKELTPVLCLLLKT